MNEFELDIQDDDYVISDGQRGSVMYGLPAGGYSVSNLGVFAGWDQVIPAIIQDMKENQFFPNVWEVNDHGNVDLLSINTDTGEYSIAQSWV